MNTLKKYFVVALAILVLPTVILASFQPVTMVKEAKRVAVFTQEQATRLFGLGYSVESKQGAITGPNVASNYFSVNGDTIYSITGKFQDGTTTIVSFLNPFGANGTSTVELARLNITGAATTSFTTSCGAAANKTAAPQYAIITGALFATSTTGFISNNLTAALGGTVDGGTTAKVALTSAYPYFNCVVTPTVASGITGAGNTFDGTYRVRISR